MKAKVKKTRNVDYLLARADIRDATLRYCRGVDRLDEALVRSAYHVDAYDDHGPLQGRVDEVIGQVLATLRDLFTSHSHTISNQLISLHGNRADVETYFTAIHVTTRDAECKQSTVRGRYIDVFEERQGDWRIARRTVVYDSRRVETFQDSIEQLGNVKRGSRNLNDASYGGIAPSLEVPMT